MDNFVSQSFQIVSICILMEIAILHVPRTVEKDSFGMNILEFVTHAKMQVYLILNAECVATDLQSTMRVNALVRMMKKCLFKDIVHLFKDVLKLMNMVIVLNVYHSTSCMKENVSDAQKFYLDASNALL